MSRRALRPSAEICHLCDFMIARPSLPRPSLRIQKTINPARAVWTTRRVHSQAAQPSNGPAQPAVKPRTSLVTSKKSRIQGGHVTQVELEKELQEVRSACKGLLALERPPTEQETVSVLAQCDSLAKLLVHEPPAPSFNRLDGAASSLLSLDDSNSKKILLHKLPPVFQRMVDELSNLAYSIVKHPPVFIAPEALEKYVSVQASLGKPQTLPEVFKLYANKPLPQVRSSPIKYSKQNPNKVANAVPLSVADKALQTAIDTKKLVLAMDIIESSYTTKAFYRAKFVRKGLLPTTGLAVAPVAAYTIASQLALLQNSMDLHMATNVAFAGILAYVGFTATIGVVAVTTTNDQMDRVTWAQGVPLRERWIREEERAAMDKVAGSWGFRESWRRGEEEGEDWDALREWIGRKGMMLDRVELMEGME